MVIDRAIVQPAISGDGSYLVEYNPPFMFRKYERLTFALTVSGAAALLVSIVFAEILLASGLVSWLIWRPRRPNIPSFVIPMCAFIAATFISLVLSPDPAINWFIRKTMLFAMILMGATFVSTTWRARTSIAILLGTATLTSIAGLVQFGLAYSHFLTTKRLADDPMVLARITGFMGHWMTFSGEQMLVWCAAVPAIVCLGRRWFLPLTIVGGALVLSFTQSVWGAAVAGVGAVSLMMPRRALMKVIVPVVLIAASASGLIYRRVAMSLGDPNFAPRTGRIELWKAGFRMIRAHPWFGVGPERIFVEFPNYSGGAAPYHGTLENDFIQMAAERGLICFATFLWFLLELLAGLFRRLKSAEEGARWIALSAIAALVGFTVSGLFEFNFGDSEVLLLFLFIVSIPFGVLEKDEAGVAVAA